jgi:hypothetical protein
MNLSISHAAAAIVVRAGARDMHHEHLTSYNIVACIDISDAAGNQPRFVAY